MASHTITFSVSGEDITISNPTEDVAVGDTVGFSSNATVYVTFDSGQWPFTGSAETITVSNTAGPYTVAADGAEIDAYQVSLQLGGTAKATGHVDIEPEPPHGSPSDPEHKAR